MLNKILIANRGEIACRVMRTAKRMGIVCVAVYSKVDAAAQHVRLADEAYCIGEAPSQQSYLHIDNIIDAAKKAQVDAIHPGYGFLSENAAFAEACSQAGIIFIGPPASAIAHMGCKRAAKAIMEKAGIATIPGYHGADQSTKTLRREADRIGYPVLLKAAAGGGGKGMRRVDSADEFDAAMAAAKREAKASFNDDSLLLEKYLLRPRHIEMQLFADQHGNVVYLFERDCSLQRRHQKIIEEAPALGVDDDLRQRMGEAAIAAAKAIDYQGAGTVEFLLDSDGAFYFMEMNTRLQVEHPVTEMITGVDLVEWQLRVAVGETLPQTQQQISMHGHAIEVRLYAEDADNQFLPATGQISHLQWPEQNEQVRIDSGVQTGDEISMYYDPMLAKLIVWQQDRPSAVHQLQRALHALQIVGVTTNCDFLTRVIQLPAWQQGAIHTHFIPEHHDALFAKPDLAGPLALVSFAYLQQLANSAMSVWQQTDGWQMHRLVPQVLRWQYLEEVYQLKISVQENTLHCEFADRQWSITIHQIDAHQFEYTFEQQHTKATVYFDKQHASCFFNGRTLQFSLQQAQLEDYQAETSAGHCDAPMPGTVIAVLAKIGNAVKRGDHLMVLEAMKMEHTIQAPMDGLVKEIYCKVGDQVKQGAELVSLDAVE